MDPQSGYTAGSLGRVVSTDGGPLCDKIQQEAPAVRVAGSGSGSLGGGRIVTRLEQSDCVRISPLSDSLQGDSESQARTSTTHPDRAQVARSALVPGPSRSHACSASPTSSQSGPATTATFRSSSFEPPAATSTRLVTVRTQVCASELNLQAPRAVSVQSSLSERGASADLRALVAESRRSGTEALYGFRWQKWLEWCHIHDVPSTNPSSMQLANFLAHLHSQRNLSASSVRGYRSAICTTIRQLGGPSFELDALLRDTTRGAAHREARNPRRVPQWDLFLVLDFLRKAPFEPISAIPFDLLTLKTTFLLALATSKRRSEIHALSGAGQDIAFHRDGSISLKLLPEFLAKTQDPGDPSPAVTIRPLSDIVARGEEDRYLCPVRCLKWYWERTRSRRSSQRRLLISINEKYQKDISAGTVSRWIRQTILKAYAQAQKDTSCLNPRAHEVRAIATSVAFQHSLPLSQVLEAASWRSENPFISHYLRDFRLTRADGTRGISFVAANAAMSVTRNSHANH